MLDVFCREPLPADNKLYDYSNVFVTHHTAGAAFGRDIADDFEKKFEKYISNQELDGVLTFDKDY